MTVSFVSESDFQDAVVDLARRCGWLVHHARPALNRRGRWSTPIQGNVGFPDLVLVRPLPPEAFLVVELKSQKGRMRPEQKTWIEAMRMSGIDVRVWRPSDWLEVEATLLAGRTAA